MRKLSARKRLIAEIVAASKNRSQSEQQADLLEQMTTEALKKLKIALQSPPSAMPDGTDIELSGEAYEIYLRSGSEGPKEPDWVLPKQTLNNAPLYGVMIEGTDVVLSDAAYSLLVFGKEEHNLGVPSSARNETRSQSGEKGFVSQPVPETTAAKYEPIIEKEKNGGGKKRR